MPRKRSLPSAGSVLSIASTASSSLSGTFVDSAAGSQEAWMYWKRDSGCWMKVYVALRKHVVWLTRAASQEAFASPLIQMAVTYVERTTLRGFLITGPSGETMELHLYDEEETWTWFDALVEAASSTRRSLAERDTQPRMSSYQRLRSSGRHSVEHEYRGTLVVYNEERKGGRWRRFWQSLRVKESLRRKIENVVDRFETAQTRATLY